MLAARISGVLELAGARARRMGIRLEAGAARAYLARVFDETDELNRQAILAALRPAAGGTLVDLGCGDGSFTRRVAEQVGARRTIGVELIEHLAAAAEAQGIEVERADLGAKLPFEDGSIDVVHSNQVIEHLPGTDHFLSEIARVLRPGGQAVVSTNNLASWHNVASLVLGWQPPPLHVSDDVIVGNPANPAEGEPGSAGQMHLRVFTGRALASLAAHHGLRVDHAETVGLYPFPARFARRLTKLDRVHGAFLVQRYTR